jgi:tRNA ligase
MNNEIHFLKDATIRGCFTYNGEIVIRGYDRFYNLNEIPMLTWKNLEHLSEFKASVKANGCIIFISAINDQLLVTSKRSIGKHSLKGREWLLKSIEKAGKSLEELISFLKGITMVCELVDQDFEDHILDYPRNKWGLYLHGINVNSHDFESWDIEKVESVACEFGMFSLQTFVFKKSFELKEFLEELDKTGTFNGQEIEGFVVRTRTLDNKPLFFKYKFKKPYLMYREFRQVTAHILGPVTKIGLKIEFNETYKYMTWVYSKLKQDSNYFNGFLEHNGIIRARKEFLMENLLDSEYLYKEKFYSNNEKELGKILILPISIVGSGKTTFGKLIKSVCPVQMAIVQSDNMPKRNTANHFIAGIMEAFKSNSIVFADKNNHLAQHRLTICQKFREKYTDGYVLALDWQVEKYDRLEVLSLCKKRILERYKFSSV